MLTFAKATRETTTGTLTGAGAATTGAVVGGTVIGATTTAMTTATLAGSTVGGLCPQRPTTGTVFGNTGTVPAPVPGPLPGTFIGPTITFAGVINPGIPTRIPPTGEILTEQGAQVQVTPATSPPTMGAPGTAGVVGGQTI